MSKPRRLFCLTILQQTGPAAASTRLGVVTSNIRGYDDYNDDDNNNNNNNNTGMCRITTSRSTTGRIYPWARKIIIL